MNVAIIGAGVFGAAAACELGRRGCNVTLLDPGPIPHPLAASTDISKVVRLDYGADAFYTALMERALDGFRAWNHAWNEALFHEDGFLILARGPLRAGGFEHDSFAVLRSRGHAPERLDEAALARRFPAWNAARYPDGYFNPEGGWAESGRVVGRLVEDARSAGVEVRADFRVSGFVAEGARVVGVRSRDGEEVRADAVVVAAGAWTPSLVPELSDRMWAVGQPVLHLKPADPAPWRAPRFVPWAADIGNTGWYGFPVNADGIVKVANHGAGRPIDPDAPRAIAPDDEGRFRSFLRDSLPALADAPLVGSRLCLYCDTFDGDFWIDRHPERPGLVVAAGGSGHGFKFAPVLGALIADCVLGGGNADGDRFRWRERGPTAHEDARFNG